MGWWADVGRVFLDDSFKVSARLKIFIMLKLKNYKLSSLEFFKNQLPPEPVSLADTVRRPRVLSQGVGRSGRALGLACSLWTCWVGASAFLKVVPLAHHLGVTGTFSAVGRRLGIGSPGTAWQIGTRVRAGRPSPC